jgi:hypothetical protein
MALALNVFKTITKVVTTSPVGIYTSPVGYTGVVLLAQCTNVGTTSQDVTFSHQRRNTVGVAVTTRILKNFPIPANDTANLLPGKLVLETNDVLLISGSNSTDLEFVVSILETLN